MHTNFKVTHLYIYPIKGLSGLALDTAFVTTRGLQYDRRWMLIDEHHQFISQRGFPILCLFKVEIEHSGFMVSYNSQSIHVPFEIEHGQAVQVKIWDDEVMALKANEAINEFFSHQLQCNCSLVFMPDQSHRMVDKNYVMNDTTVSFADGYPILMIGEESLNLLNSKLAEPIEMDRFRPNIVFEGGVAHQEDLMKHFSIGELAFMGVKPCARCQVPSINQKTGLIGKEPSRTLASYRNVNHKINFGQNVIVLNEGKIRVCDHIKLEN